MLLLGLMYTVAFCIALPHWHLAFGILIKDYINYVSKKSAKSFVNNVWHNAGTQVKVVKIRHFYSRLRII